MTLELEWLRGCDGVPPRLSKPYVWTYRSRCRSGLVRIYGGGTCELPFALPRLDGWLPCRAAPK